VCSFNL
jgi:pyruvate/2-oxoglutarate dehydrogenase complex dihydrolipoamide acyltransferase (E2) component